MKKEAVSHTKMGRLMRKLKLRRFQAVGLCEMLWHTTAREAPAGDIGKLTNEDIAIALDWNKEPDELMAGFVAAELIKVHPAFRMVIHDWSEHAEDSVHSKLARAKAYFWNGKAPKITGLRKADAEAATAHYAMNPVATPVQPVANPSTTTNPALPNPALPNPTQPCPSKTGAPDGAEDSPAAIADPDEPPPERKLAVVPKAATPLQMAREEIAMRIWERHPDGYKSDPQVIEKRLTERTKELPSVEEKIKRMREIDARHARWCASEQWAGKGFVNNLGNWFTKGFCVQEPPQPEKLRGGAQEIFQIMAENMSERGKPF